MPADPNTVNTNLQARLWRSKRFCGGLGYLTLLVVTGIYCMWIVPFDPNDMHMSQSAAPPSLDHLFGRDLFGRDLLAGVLAGACPSLGIALASVSLASLIGVVLGLIAGYWRGLVGYLVGGLVDIILAFPGMLLTLAFASLLGPSRMNIVLAVAATGWTTMARLVRAQVLTLRERNFVEASVAMGAHPWRTLAVHLLPALSTPIVIAATFSISGVILVEASLSYLGLASDDGMPSWGGLLNQGRSALVEAPHLSVVPGLMIVSTILACNAMGDALRDALDPKRQKIKG